MAQLQSELESLIKNIFSSEITNSKKITNFGHLGGKNYTHSEDMRILLHIEGINAPILLFFNYHFGDNDYPIQTKEDKLEHNIKGDKPVDDDNAGAIHLLHRKIIENEDKFIQLFRKHQPQTITIKQEVLYYMMIIGEKMIEEYKWKNPFEVDFKH